MAASAVGIIPSRDHLVGHQTSPRLQHRPEGHLAGFRVCYGNAVFLMVAGKANRPVGAELRGTGKRPWRGMAPGSRKDRGYFWVGAKGSGNIVLCESAIDAISCFQLHSTQLHSEYICISTAGRRASFRGAEVRRELVRGLSPVSGASSLMRRSLHTLSRGVANTLHKGADHWKSAPG